MARIDQVFEDADLAAIYDHFNRWSAGDDFYLALARESAGRVLDLGCGTGMLACRLAAEGLSVVGVDPAEGMLSVARSRPGTQAVEWVKGDGQSLRLPQRFDLIYMTGHAFQALLTDTEAVAVLRNMALHLAPGGRLAFETRNPAAQAWLRWTPQESRSVIDTPEHGRIEQWFEASADIDSGIVDIVQHDRYLDRGEYRVGRSRIRFITRDHLARLATQAGLTVVAWYGDWDRSPLAPDSREIIAVAGRSS